MAKDIQEAYLQLEYASRDVVERLRYREVIQYFREFPALNTVVSKS